jgi:site-specific DNA recombinase
MKPAVLYARVSSREQQQEGYSIQAQLKTLHEYANRNGFAISREFIEIESAKAPGRAFFDEMVTYCQGRSKTRPVWRSKSRPVDSYEIVMGLRGRRAAGA